jgi:PAS domain S-box-containing protein
MLAWMAELSSNLISIAEALPEGAFVENPLRGIVFANAAFARFVGTSGVEGTASIDLVHPDDRSEARICKDAALAVGKTSRPHVFRFRRPDGSYASGECTAIRHRAPAQDLLLFLVHDHSFLERLGDRCLSKPFDIEEVERLIGRALRS